MTRQVEISPAAQHDLADIWAYVSEDDEDTATQLIQSFYQKCLVLAEMPGLGRDRSRDIGEGVRSLPVRKYVLFYRVTDDSLSLIRVRHGAQDSPFSLE